MNTRRRIGWTALAAFAAVAVSPVSAKAPDASGWWSRVQQAPVLLPVPGSGVAPTAEPGQLVVADAPDEPLAIAALRFVLTPQDTVPALLLRAVDGTNAEALTLEACMASTRWEPADGGRWADRPQYDCDLGRAPGIRTEEGNWQFDVAPLLDGETLDVVIVPAAPADGPTRQPASVTFAAPGEDALVTVAAPIEDEFAEAPFVPEAETFDPGALVPLDPVSGVPLDLGPLFMDTDAAAASVLERPRILPPPLTTGTATPIPEIDPGRAGIAALILFAASAVVAGRLGRERNVVLLNAPHLLRGNANRSVDAEPVLAGIGRFMRTRTGSPPPLN